MLSLLKKYRQWLVCFFASLLCVVFSSVVFAQDVPESVDVVNTQQQLTSVDYDYDNYAFARSHQEPNFYQYP